MKALTTCRRHLESRDARPLPYLEISDARPGASRAAPAQGGRVVAAAQGRLAVTRCSVCGACGVLPRALGCAAWAQLGTPPEDTSGCTVKPCKRLRPPGTITPPKAACLALAAGSRVRCGHAKALSLFHAAIRGFTASACVPADTRLAHHKDGVRHLLLRGGTRLRSLAQWRNRDPPRPAKTRVSRKDTLHVGRPVRSATWTLPVAVAVILLMPGPCSCMQGAFRRFHPGDAVARAGRSGRLRTAF